MILDNYDDFNFMVILLFIYFILIMFIIMLITNSKAKAQQAAKDNPQTTYNGIFPQTTSQCVADNSFMKC